MGGLESSTTGRAGSRGPLHWRVPWLRIGRCDFDNRREGIELLVARGCAGPAMSPDALSLRALGSSLSACNGTVLELQGLTKRYGARLALDDVSLSVQAGITGLLGPNGSGKSTLIKSLLGLLRLDRGEVAVLGLPLRRALRAIRDQVGYVPEDDCFLSGLTGIESAIYMARLSGLRPTEALRRAHEAMDFADIAQERYRNVETYSTGMRQKLKFAQAIVHDPRLLILDEPTTGLDPEQRSGLLRKIKHLADRHGKSILISTHILHDVNTICDSVVIMSTGRVRLVDNLENLQRPTVRGMLLRPDRAIAGGAESPAVARLIASLASDGLQAEPRPDGSLWVHGIDGDESWRIWRAAERSGVALRQLGPARNSLEEIFLHVVREATDAPA